MSSGTRKTPSSGIQPNGDATNSVYDPEIMDRISTSSDGRKFLIDDGIGGVTTTYNDHHHDHHDGDGRDDDIEQHLAIMDISQRLREKRRRVIRRYTIVFLTIATILLVAIGITSRTIEEEEKEIQEQEEQEAKLTILPVPPVDIASKCSLNSIQQTITGLQECESVCEIAECCFIPIGFELSCQIGNELTCPKYQKYCTILGLEPSSTTIGEDESIINPITPPSTTNDSDSDSDPSSSTMTSNPPVPTTTSPPPISDDTTTTTTTATTTLSSSSSSLKEQINEACLDDDFEVIALPDQLSVCEQFCQLSTCCFNHYCVPPDGIDCLDYSGCYILYETNENDGAGFDENDTSTSTTTTTTTNNDTNDSSLLDLTQQIQTACDTTTTTTTNNDGNGGMIDDPSSSSSLCLTLCTPGACCFEPNLSCSAIPCDVYAGCQKALYPNYSDNPSSSATGSGGTTTHSTITEGEVNDACQNHNTNNVSGAVSLCEQICQAGACCFSQGGTNGIASCTDEFCRSYTACQVIYVNSSP